MKVSVIYSNYDRTDLLRAGLAYQVRQTLPAEEFEVVIVDDGSTEDYGPVLEEFRGKLQMQWVRIDHTQHRIFKELNPGGKPVIPPADEPLWYHTPALTHNIGFRKARGTVVCVTQPEILMKENCLELGYARAVGASVAVYGMPWQSERRFRKQFFVYRDERKEVSPYAVLKSWDGFGGGGGISRPELYYFLTFVHKSAVYTVGGVDEEYLRGTYAEDDDFRYRLGKAGWPQRVFKEVEGIHLNHEHVNTGRHDRTSNRWRRGRDLNRARWAAVGSRALKANPVNGWGDLSLIEKEKVYEL